MKVLQLQGVGGASGDMVLAALISLGVDPAALERTLAPLVPASLRLRAIPCRSHGLQGAQVRVEVMESVPGPRRWDGIRERIRDAALPPQVEQEAVAVFQRLAEAEAEVHGIAPEAVEFHEIGALDSIVDVVGACLGRMWLGVDRVVVSPLPLGQGTVECAHGLYPTPAPATAVLLRGFPVVQTSEPFELVTPTGAALLRSWASAEGLPDGARITATGHGFGHRELLGRPNLLRAVLYDWTPDPVTAPCQVLECQLDDTVPELIGHVTQALMAAGAYDVYTTPVYMKKQRPGVLVTVLASMETRDRLLDLLFRETTTLGVREATVQRTMLPRRSEEVATRFGPVRVKIGVWDGAEVTASPEMDDCVERAAEYGASVRQVWEAAQRALRRRPGAPPGGEEAS